MQTIYGNYKIDDLGNIYSKRGILKTRIDNGSVRININQKWVSYARVIATYLLPNINNYDRLIFKDKNPLNCSLNNLKWVSENKYQLYVYKARMADKKIKKEEALNKCQCPVLKEYYITENIEIVNNHFLNISKKINVFYWKEIMGFVYLDIIEKVIKYRILYKLEQYIISRLCFYYIDFKRNIK